VVARIIRGFPARPAADPPHGFRHPHDEYGNLKIDIRTDQTTELLREASIETSGSVLSSDGRTGTKQVGALDGQDVMCFGISDGV
jgi:hypothetical protein